MHIMHRHHAAQLRFDLHDHGGRAGGHHGDARAVAFMVNLGDSQAFDIVATAREQPDDARQNARLIVDHDGERMGLKQFSIGVFEVIGRMFRRAFFDFEWGHQTSTPPSAPMASATPASPISISLCGAPEGIIG